MFGSFLTLFLNIGILISTVGASYLQYSVVPCVMIIFPVIFLSGFIFMPETPQFLLKKNKIEVRIKNAKNCKKLYLILFYRLQKNHFDFIKIVKLVQLRMKRCKKNWKCFEL